MPKEKPIFKALFPYVAGLLVTTLTACAAVYYNDLQKAKEDISALELQLAVFDAKLDMLLKAHGLTYQPSPQHPQ